jgi:hypothetical protein
LTLLLAFCIAALLVVVIWNTCSTDGGAIIAWLRGTHVSGQAKKSDDFVDLECAAAQEDGNCSGTDVELQSASLLPLPPTKGRDTGSDLRGYKILSDGRKTTFFNRELSAADKALIGDTTPQKITGASCGRGVPVVAGAAAWNAAGTWEEKNKTKWATERLSGLLRSAEATCETTTVRFTSVNSFDGDASITFVRGKKKFLFDFSNVQCEWEAVREESDQEGGSRYAGRILLADVASDCMSEYESEVVWSAVHSSAGMCAEMRPPPMYAAVLKKQLHQLAVTQIAQFIADFHGLQAA